jgi:hypothetical protein
MDQSFGEYHAVLKILKHTTEDAINLMQGKSFFRK